MKIEILKRIEDYGYWPGQVIVNHEKERDWLRAGLAKPVIEITQAAQLKPFKPDPRAK